MVARLVVGAALIAGGLLAIRYRTAIARSRIESEVDHLRHSLLNASRVEREAEAWRTRDALRSTEWGVAATALVIIGVGVAAIVSAFV